MTPFKLDDNPKIEAGFKIPDNYFENFEANLIEKLSQETIANESKVISIFRKRKYILISVAAVLILALTIPIIYQNTKSKELDSTTIENYLAEETHLNQLEIISKIEPKNNIIILNTKDIETQTLEDMLASNPNIENLVIEN